MVATIAVTRKTAIAQIPILIKLSCLSIVQILCTMIIEDFLINSFITLYHKKDTKTNYYRIIDNQSAFVITCLRVL